MSLVPSRILIAEGTSAFNILVSICREYSGSQRAGRLHTFFVAYINSLCKDSFESPEQRQRYYDHLQTIGSNQSSYQSAFEDGKEYPSKGLDMVREFSGALALEASTKKLNDLVGLEGIDVMPLVGLDPLMFKDINTLGFNVTIVGRT
jgi:hypothetical protein